MHAFLMNGGPAGGSDGDALEPVEELLRAELAGRGYDVDVAVLREMPEACCPGCPECWSRTAYACPTDEAARDLADRFVGSDLVVLLTPVTFGGYSSVLKEALDRSIGLVSPFFRRVDGAAPHRSRPEQHPAVVGLGVLSAPDPEDEELFRTLLERNATHMEVPAWAVDVAYRGEDARALRDRLDGLLDRVGVRA